MIIWWKTNCNFFLQFHHRRRSSTRGNEPWPWVPSPSTRAASCSWSARWRVVSQPPMSAGTGAIASSRKFSCANPATWAQIGCVSPRSPGTCWARGSPARLATPICWRPSKSTLLSISIVSDDCEFCVLVASKERMKGRERREGRKSFSTNASAVGFWMSENCLEYEAKV